MKHKVKTLARLVTVGTEEAVGDEAAVSVPQGAEVEHLALGVRVCVLATLGLSSSNISMGRSV